MYSSILRNFFSFLITTLIIFSSILTLFVAIVFVITLYFRIAFGFSGIESVKNVLWDGESGRVRILDHSQDEKQIKITTFVDGGRVDLVIGKGFMIGYQDLHTFRIILSIHSPFLGI